MLNFERRLGLFSVVSISAVSMLGSGLFVLPGIIAFHTGPSTWLAYLMAALFVLPAAMSKSELATAMPSTGGTYVYLERSFGPLPGIISGLGLWLSFSLKSAFALIGLSSYLAVFTSIDAKTIALIMLSIIFILNLLGVSFISKTFTFIVILTFLALTFLILGSYWQIPNQPLESYFSGGASGFFMATAMVFVSYAGVTKVAAIAEEIKEPEKNLPRGILISLFFVSILYCFTSYILTIKMPLKDLANNLRPVYDLALQLGGVSAGLFIAFIACLTMASMANAGVLASSRFPFAMSRDKLLPKFLGTLGRQFITPFWSITASSLVIALMIVFLKPYQVAKFASAFIIFIYMVENFTVLVLREFRAQWYKPTYHAPLYPFLQIVGFLGGLFCLFYIGFYYIFFSVGTITILGGLIYLLYSRKKVSRRGLLAIREGKAGRHLERDAASVVQEKFQQNTSSMVALFGNETSADNLAELALALNDDDRGTAVIYFVEVPEQTDITDINWQTPLMRSSKRRMAAISEYKKQPIYYETVFSHDIYQKLARISEHIQCRWLVTQWLSPSISQALLPYDPIKRLRDEIPSHIITFKDGGVRFYKKILVLLQQTQNDLLNIYIADHLAKLYNGTIDLLLYQTESREASVLKEYVQMLSNKCTSQVGSKIIQGDDKEGQVVEMTSSYDLLILTDTSENKMIERVFNQKTSKIIEGALCSVVAIQKKTI